MLYVLSLQSFSPLFRFYFEKTKTFIFMTLSPDTAPKVSKYGVFSGLYFLVFGLNYSLNLRFQSHYRKIRIRKTPYLDTFHAVRMKLNLEENSPSSRL